ncbi:MAG TPA: hypothetical protein VIR31_04845, partial [Nitrososphaeraceae archaeon]
LKFQQWIAGINKETERKQERQFDARIIFVIVTICKNCYMHSFMLTSRCYRICIYQPELLLEMFYMMQTKY